MKGFIMDSLEKYEVVNECETFKALADVIRSFAMEDGSILGRTRSFNAEKMASYCENFTGLAPNVLTREFGIRQQALYILHYQQNGSIMLKPYGNFKKEECDHPFKRLHWVGDTVFCNKCNKNVRKADE